MSAQPEPGKSPPRDVANPELLEISRRRWNAFAWLTLALSIGLFIGGLWLPLGGQASGQAMGIDGKNLLGELKGSGSYFIWGSLVIGLFRLFLKFLQRTWEFEDRQAAIHFARRDLDGKDRQEMIARLIEHWQKLPRFEAAHQGQKKKRPLVKRLSEAPKKLITSKRGRTEEVEVPPEL